MQIHRTVRYVKQHFSAPIEFSPNLAPFQRNAFRNFEFAKDRISIHFKFINFKNLSKNTLYVREQN